MAGSEERSQSRGQNSRNLARGISTGAATRSTHGDDIGKGRRVYDRGSFKYRSERRKLEVTPVNAVGPIGKRYIRLEGAVTADVPYETRSRLACAVYCQG